MVDVYQEWCGPCKAMVSIFKRVKLELGDDLLRFAVVSICKKAGAFFFFFFYCEL